jgi:hypothetical protein
VNVTSIFIYIPIGCTVKQTHAYAGASNISAEWTGLILYTVDVLGLNFLLKFFRVFFSLDRKIM